jgi:hypothetical protein
MMKRPHTSLMALITVVAVVASGLAALRQTMGYASEFLTLVIGALLISVLTTGFGRGRFRAFCAGFAFFGCGYLILWSSPLGIHLPTTSFFDRACLDLLGTPPIPRDSWDAEEIRKRHDEKIDRFRRWAHTLATLSLALFGGVAVLRLGLPERKIEVHDPPEGTLLRPGFSSQSLREMFGS